jgi:hypothetical protein
MSLEISDSEAEAIRWAIIHSKKCLQGVFKKTWELELSGIIGYGASDLDHEHLETLKYLKSRIDGHLKS